MGQPYLTLSLLEKTINAIRQANKCESVIRPTQPAKTKPTNINNTQTHKHINTHKPTYTQTQEPTDTQTQKHIKHKPTN